MAEETRTPGTDLALPSNAALAQVPQTDIVSMLLETAGTIKLTDEQRKIIFAKVDPDLVEIREDGIVYLPAVEYKQVLCETFGLEWAVVPESPKPVEVDGVILWGFHLFVQGQPVAFAWGEQSYKKGSYMMSYGDAMEGAKSNAIMRLCKQIGVAQNLWRPSFIRKWKRDHAEEYEGRDRNGNRKMMWRRLENAKPLADEKEAEPDTDAGTGDDDRFRRTAFLMAEYLKIDEGRMKAEVKEQFGVDSRADLESDQWVDYIAYLSGTMSESQKEDYKRWLEVRTALKPLAERGMDKKELRFYLQTLFLRLDVLDVDLPEDLATRLKRSCASDEYYARLQRAVQTAKEWGDAIGGQGKAAELLEHLDAAVQDVTSGSFSLSGFFGKMGVEAQEDESYRLTDISPEVFEGWKVALGLDDSKPDPPHSGGEPNLDSLQDVLAEHAETPTDDTGGDDTQDEQEKGQAQGAADAEWDVTRQTRKRISELLAAIEIYGDPRSRKFKERIKSLLGGRWLLKMQCMTEVEGQKIIKSLEDELGGVDNVSFVTSDPVEEETTEEDRKALISMYDLKASKRFSGFPPWREWEKAMNLPETKNTGNDWPITDLKRGIALLEGVVELEAPQPTPATPEEPVSDGKCTDDEFKELGRLFTELLPDKQYAMGSTEARNLISESKAVKGMFARIKNLTTEEVADLTLFLNDKISEMKHEAEEKAKSAAKVV